MLVLARGGFEEVFTSPKRHQGCNSQGPGAYNSEDSGTLPANVSEEKTALPLTLSCGHMIKYKEPYH